MLVRAWRGICWIIGLRWLPSFWVVPCLVALGALVGLAAALVHVSRASSYLSDDPETCVNCHVMRTQYASWQHSGHSEVATCNDCHVPHQTPIHSLAFKARDGIYHSSIFTLRLEPQVIEISSGAVPVVENNCRRCHDQVIADVTDPHFEYGDRVCWDCHREVPHGRVRSLSTVPKVMMPELPVPTQRQVPRIGGREPEPEQGQDDGH